ncbi:DUF6675 family protein [Gracilinema caldarium]|uniref:DUF6675 family protein n=1 Tax=Gracilinema caldarium TaxID=215591 RepID=UPI0026F035EA|nr:DUF6675 family protein [Gracilinema caldarium]
MKKIFIVMFLALSLFGQLGAASISDFISKETFVLLQKDQKIVNVSTSNMQALYVPNNGLQKKLVQEIIETIHPTLLVENLYLYRKPASKIGMVWLPAEQLRLFNNIRSISTLTGIEYYSASRKKMRTFYEFSTVIDNLENKKTVADPVVSSLPNESTLFARQKDLTFGDNVYRYDYKTTENSIVFIQTNLTTLSYGIIPLVQKENLKSLIGILDCDEGLLLYAATFAKASMIPGVEGKIRDSFANRTEAVYKWFVEKADSVFK